MRMESELTVHVLFRFSKKTGKIDTTMTGLGSAMMQMWALSNTPKTKMCMIVERDTGVIKFTATGTDDGFPEVASLEKDGDLGNIEDYGIQLDALQTEFIDDRFDN